MSKMMSYEYIQELADEAGVAAAERGVEPYGVTEHSDRSEWGSSVPFPFPNLGDHRPEGWELVDQELADKTGLGRADEPALTIGQLQRWAVPGFGYALIEEGQFQVVIGRFQQN